MGSARRNPGPRYRAALAPLAPLLVARLERRFARPLLGLGLLQAAVFAAIAAIVDASPAVVVALVLLNGLLAPTARTSARASLAALTRPLRLLRQANALANVLFTVNGVLAPALGGLLVAVAGPAAALLADALTFLFTAALIGGLRVPAAESDRRKRRVRAAVAHVRRRPVVASLLAGDAAINVFVMAHQPDRGRLKGAVRPTADALDLLLRYYQFAELTGARGGSGATVGT